MENISIRQGETFEMGIECDDTSALSVRFLATSEGVAYIDEIEQFIDGQATIRTEATNIPLGDYEFTLTITYSDGVIDILPDSSECSGDDCALPVLTICKTNNPQVIS
jgi:hypothetical protein